MSLWFACDRVLKALIILFIDMIYYYFFMLNQNNLYMFYHDSDLLHGIYNTTNEHIRRKLNSFHQLFQIFLIFIMEWFKKFFYDFICLTFIIISMLSRIKCIARSSSLSSVEEIKQVVIANWIFWDYFWYPLCMV